VLFALFALFALCGLSDRFSWVVLVCVLFLRAYLPISIRIDSEAAKKCKVIVPFRSLVQCSVFCSAPRCYVAIGYPTAWVCPSGSIM